VRDGSGAGQNLLYVDGVLEASASPTYTGNFSSGAAVTIGDDASGAFDFTGSIDEVAIYGRALTETMVVQHSMLAQGYCNAKPLITSVPTDPATEDVEYTHPFKATDADGDSAFTWSLTNAPSGMTVDPGGGVLTWTPGNESSSGEVTVTVSDSVGGTATQNFTIAVTNVNDAPVISTTAPTAAEVGKAYSYDADATDDDGDTLSWSLVSGPADMTIDASTGAVSWTPPSNASETTNYSIMVSDGNGGTASENVTLTVTGTGSSSSGGGGGGGGCFIDSINLMQ
jgi:hypothetical protein